MSFEISPRMWLTQLFVLFALNAVGPGLLVVRRLRLSPTEKLVASVAVSFAFVYLAAFAIYLLNVEARWHFAVTVVGVVTTVLTWRDLARLFAVRHVQRIVLGWLAFVAWGLLLLAFVRHYAGGTWSVDWLEHYHRALFFLDHRPNDTLLGGIYLLPARPPVMNLVATAFLAQVDAGYECYQVLALLLNSLVYLPACLVARASFRKAGRGTPWLVLLLLAANPMVAQNLTYSWTRLFTAFYVVLGVPLYLRGWRKASTPHTVLAFAALAAGSLVHFSAGPYAVLIGLHYLAIGLWRRGRHRIAEIALSALACAVIVVPYVAWTVRTFGAPAAFASNTSLTGQSGTAPAGRPADVAANVGMTLLPTVLWRPSTLDLPEFQQGSAAGRVRDFAFLVYLHGYPWAVGSAGMILAAVLAWGVVRGRRKSLDVSRAPDQRPPDELRWFWLPFLPAVFLLSIAVVPGGDRFGIAHLGLQPLVVMTLAFLAAGFDRLPLQLRWLLVPGLLLDVAFGVFLHFTLQSRDYTLDLTPAGLVARSDGPTLSQSSQANAAYKIAPLATLIRDQDPELLRQTTLAFFGDRFGGLLLPLQAAVGAALAVLMWVGLRAHLFPARPAELPTPPPRGRTKKARKRR